MFQEFLDNFQHNLFKPLLLFFYAGFSIPLLGVPFVFPHVIYEGLTMYLLIAIGWHGGEELASMNGAGVRQAAGFMLIGFCLNFVIGCVAYFLLRKGTRLRKIDAATVGGYYGSDSAGTFVTCLGVLGAAQIAYAAYMPVMLAIMEIPGCLVALFLVSRLRRHGMDPRGNMPGEAGYELDSSNVDGISAYVSTSSEKRADEDCDGIAANGREHGSNGGTQVAVRPSKVVTASRVVADAKVLAAVAHIGEAQEKPNGFAAFINWKLMHEVFLNPGLYLLFVGIVIGYISRLQGAKVTKEDDFLFITLFQGALCLFLLEMGMTACKRLRDLKAAGIPFIAFGLIAPNIFATIGIFVAHGYSAILGEPFDIGTYVLFSVLCAAASYIAVPAVQRLAIPEASPTLPLAASLGLTFSYNVTIGIPVYIEIVKAVTNTWPVAGAVVS